MSEKQKTIMMIGGGIQEVKAVEFAQNAGYKVLVTDRNEEAPCFPLADYTSKIDGRDVEGLIAYTLLNKEKLNIAGVFTFTELVTSVAAVANACSLPGASMASATKCQNKELCKCIWIRDQIPTPRGRVVNTIEEAKILFNELHKKAIVKPLVGFGGIGVHKIHSEVDIDELYHGDNNTELLMEELVFGTMHDVNAVFDSNGKFIPLGCFDRFFNKDYPVETGAVYPSQLNKNLIKEAYMLTENAALSLGINWGPVKSDLVLTQGGFQILEMAPRLHGPKGSLHLTSIVNTVSHFECILDLLTGDDATINMDKNIKGMAAYEIIDHPGRPFSSVKGIGNTQDQEFEILLFNTFSSTNCYRDSSDVIGYIFGKGSSLNNIRDDLNTVKRKIRFG